MFLDRLKCVTAVRAEKLTGIARESIAKAMDLYTATHGLKGLKFIRENKNRKIRLAALDEWISSMERSAAYA